MAGLVFVPNGTTVDVDSVDVAAIVTLTLPDQSKGEAESTNNDSNFTRSFVPALRDNGSLQLGFRRLVEDAGQEALLANYDANDETVAIVITFPSQATDDSLVHTISFNAFVTARSTDLPQDADEVAMQTVSLKVSGAITEATA